MHVRMKATVNPRIASLRELAQLTPHDMQRMTDRCDQQFRLNERGLFATDGGSGGTRWQSLSPAYAEAKRRTHPGRKILTRDGTLRDGLTQKAHPDHVATYRITPRAVIELGTKNPVAGYHAEGGGRLPKRDPMAHTPAQEAGYFQVVREQLAAKLDRVQRVLAAWRGR